MTILAITVLVVAFALIVSDRVNKTLVALCGAAVVVAAAVVGSDDVFYSPTPESIGTSSFSYWG